MKNISLDNLPFFVSLLMCGCVTILLGKVDSATKLNHSINVVIPNDRNVHTQTIESHWAKTEHDMRRRIGRMAMSTTSENYPVDYVWRNIISSNSELYEDFFGAIHYFYLQ